MKFLYGLAVTLYESRTSHSLRVADAYVANEIALVHALVASGKGIPALGSKGSPSPISQAKQTPSLVKANKLPSRSQNVVPGGNSLGEVGNIGSAMQLDNGTSTGNRNDNRA